MLITGAQAGAIIGTIIGAGQIPSKWKDPIADRLDSEVIGFEHLRISEISRWTVEIGKNYGVMSRVDL